MFYYSKSFFFFIDLNSGKTTEYDINFMNYNLTKKIIK